MRWLMRDSKSGRLLCADMCVRCTAKVPCDGDSVPGGRQRVVSALCLLVPVQVVR
jgi:hypothetical protein